MKKKLITIDFCEKIIDEMIQKLDELKSGLKMVKESVSEDSTEGDGLKLASALRPIYDYINETHKKTFESIIKISRTIN